MEIAKYDLIKINHEEAWKYFISVYNAVESMRAYRHIINECLNKKRDNFDRILNGELEIPDSEKKTFPPGNLVRIDGINMSISFLVSQFVHNFFQASRNCFDYMAQIIAVFFCGDLNLKNVDMSKVIKKLDYIKNEDVKQLLNNVSSSEIYQYLCDYNNTVKHNYDMGLLFSVKADTLEPIGKIPAFEKDLKDTTHSYPVKDIVEQMKIVHQYTNDTFGELIGLIWPEKTKEIDED